MFAVMFDWADVPYQNAAKPPYSDSRAQLLGLRSMRRACYRPRPGGTASRGASSRSNTARRHGCAARISSTR